MIDLYTKAVLTVIALALSLLALRPLMPQPALAADPVAVKIVEVLTTVRVMAGGGPLQVECVDGCRR